MSQLPRSHPAHAVVPAPRRDALEPELRRRTLVVGLGKTGLSVVRFLVSAGVEVAVTDSRPEPPALAAVRGPFPEVALFLGRFDAGAFERAEQLVVSPGVAISEPAVAAAADRGVPVYGDIELFARHVDAPVVAITGSNGKSTVTTLVGEMAAHAGWDTRVGGNLGTPALDLLADRAPDLYVLELSSFQLETTRSLRPAAAVVLNVSADHLDRYRSLDEYAAAKASIYRGARTAVINGDDPIVAGFDIGAAERCEFSLARVPEPDGFGLRELDGEPWLVRGAAGLLPAAALKIRGRHNLANALAAFALGEALGLPRAALVEAAQSFAGLPHRTQWVAERDGVSWYNDSKGTNVGATLAAINGFPGKVVLLAGGIGKGADFTPLRAALAEKGRALVVFGRDARLIAEAVGDACPIHGAADLGEVITCARVCARPGDTVLLSPACASFDMFRNFEDRGDRFVAAVQAMLS